MADKTKPETAPAVVVETPATKAERVRVTANANLTLPDGTAVNEGQTVEMDAVDAERLIAITSVRKA